MLFFRITTFDVVQLFINNIKMVCKLILDDVIQDSVCLVTCPVLGFHYINHSEIILENVM